MQSQSLKVKLNEIIYDLYLIEKDGYCIYVYTVCTYVCLYELGNIRTVSQTSDIYLYCSRTPRCTTFLSVFLSV